MPASDAKVKANAKYDAKAYDKFLIRVKKGNKEIIEAAAKEGGKSLNGYVVEAVDKQLVASGKSSIISDKEGD